MTTARSGRQLVFARDKSEPVVIDPKTVFPWKLFPGFSRLERGDRGGASSTDHEIDL
jgi:hypothetical protein